MMKVPDVSVVIVSHNTQELLRACLEAVSRSCGLVTEIIVVDNASGDGSAAMVRELFPRTRLIVNRENRGFAKASNAGLRVAHGRYLLLLNSDTEVVPETLSGVVGFMDKNRLAAATVKLVLPDGQIDPACHRGFPTPLAAFAYTFKLEKLFPRSRLFGGYHLGYRGFTTVHEIDCPSGAFFLVRSDVLDKVGFLDESYFMYAEDIDWAWRIKNAGFKIFYLPQFQVLHRKKQSGRANLDPQRRRATAIMFYENNLLFYRKHFRKRYSRLVSLLVELFYFVRIGLVKVFGF